MFGPRGCGKSTWVKQHFEKTKFINLLDEGRYQEYLADPSLFHDELRTLAPGSWVAVDEIQRLPQLLNEVHRLIEDRRLKFVLTGSSARKLKRSGVNLFAGRAVRRMMYPLTPMEMKGEFNLATALTFGTLPLMVRSEDPKDTLNSYVRMYLKEEVQAEALVKNLAGFSRFLPIAALFHGQALNLANIARDAGVSRSTVQGFFEILEDTLMGARLPALETRLRVREKKHQKFYWVDGGLVRAARKQLSHPAYEELGPLLEGLVHMMLCFQRDTYGEIDELAYWSPAEAKLTEVDFVIRKGRELIAVEVKAVTRLRPEHLLGLQAISDLPGLKRKILVYMGKERMLKDRNIEIFPFSDFAKLLERREI